MKVERRSWWSNHLATAATSLIVSGIMAFSAMAYGFTQTTIENEATLKQHVAVLDSKLDMHIQSYKEDAEWIKKHLQSVITATAVLQSNQENNRQ